LSRVLRDLIPKEEGKMAKKKKVLPADRDPYAYMEQNGSDRVQSWLVKQAAATEEYLRGIPLRDELAKRFDELFSADSVSAPSFFGKRCFFCERRSGQELAVLYVQDGLDGTPRVVIDPGTLSPDQTTVLEGWLPSSDGNLLAYELSEAGNDKVSIHVMDVRTGEQLPDLVPDVFYPRLQDWSEDGTGFWYNKHDPSKPMEEAKLYNRLYFHRMGTADHLEDKMVFGGERDKNDLLSLRSYDEGRYLVIGAIGQSEKTKEFVYSIYAKDTLQKNGTFRAVLLNFSELNVVVHRGVMYLRMVEGTERFRILKLPLEVFFRGRFDFQHFIPEGKGKICEVRPFKDELIVHAMENVHSVLYRYSLDGKMIAEIPLPLGVVGSIEGGYENEEMFFEFDSFVTPPTIYRYSFGSREPTVLKQKAVKFDPGMLAVEQVWYSSKDGTKIPMFLVHKKGLKKNGNNPTVLYGYGGFDVPLMPDFDQSIVPFLEKGGVYAVANLRGGGEFGKAWHEAGMRKNKQNVFDDFESAGKWLIKHRYTKHGRLALMGGSNGGLLVLATMVQHPGLAKAIVSQVPVADMLNFHRFFGGVYWIPDYGDPDDPDMRRYLLGYSPCHNVVDGEKYPAVFIATSDGDDRVHPMHSYKMTARLQEANASGNPILLRVELKAGHGGASSVSKAAEQCADEWGFIFKELGME